MPNHLLDWPSYFSTFKALKRNEVLQNLHEILKRLAEVVPGKGKNVRALYIKSSQSCSLPIFSSAVAAAAPEGGDEGTA